MRSQNQHHNKHGGHKHVPRISHFEYPLYNYELDVASDKDASQDETIPRDDENWNERLPAAEEKVKGEGRVFVSNPQGQHWVENNNKGDVRTEPNPIRRLVKSHARSSTVAPASTTVTDDTIKAEQAPKMEAVVQPRGDAFANSKLHEEPEASADLYFFGKLCARRVAPRKVVSFLDFYCVPRPLQTACSRLLRLLQYLLACVRLKLNTLSILDAAALIALKHIWYVYEFNISGRLSFTVVFTACMFCFDTFVLPLWDSDA